jgi:hypothetical protein
MGWARGEAHEYRSSVGKPDERRSFGTPKHRREGITSKRARACLVTH